LVQAKPSWYVYSAFSPADPSYVVYLERLEYCMEPFSHHAPLTTLSLSMEEKFSEIGPLNPG